MRLSVGWILSAGVIVAATAAGAQTLPPEQQGAYSTTSDVGRPYAAMPPDSMPPRYAPALLPPREVYTVVRENGYSPLGAPQQRGFIYSIVVIDPNGDDGRLVIDARDGRIVRFMPAYRIGDRTGDEGALSYGPPGAMPSPPVSASRGSPRPPASVPRMASRSPAAMPLPKPPPRAVAEPKAPVAAAPPLAPAPAPVQQSAAAAPPAATAPPAAAPAPVAAKPPVQVLPTQTMPKAQGLD